MEARQAAAVLEEIRVLARMAKRARLFKVAAEAMAPSQAPEEAFLEARMAAVLAEARPKAAAEAAAAVRSGAAEAKAVPPMAAAAAEAVRARQVVFQASRLARVLPVPRDPPLRAARRQMQEIQTTQVTQEKEAMRHRARVMVWQAIPDASSSGGRRQIRLRTKRGAWARGLNRSIQRTTSSKFLRTYL
jgi:hypothetical protein